MSQVEDEKNLLGTLATDNGHTLNGWNFQGNQHQASCTTVECGADASVERWGGLSHNGLSHQCPWTNSRELVKSVGLSDMPDGIWW